MKEFNDKCGLSGTIHAARRWADMEPLQVQRELEEQARGDKIQQRREMERRNTEHMQNMMSRWLQGDHQD